MDKYKMELKKIVLLLMVVISTIFNVKADTIQHSMTIEGGTDVSALAGSSFEINVTVQSEENDMYVVYIPKSYFSVTRFDSAIFTSSENADYIMLTANLGSPELIGKVNNTTIGIDSNHQTIADGFTTQIFSKVIENDSSTIDKGLITFNFTNPTQYSVTKFERIIPNPNEYDAVVNQLLTYDLKVESTAPHTTLKNGIITIPVPAGFKLGDSEPGNINSKFSQPGGAGTPIISIPADIDGRLSGNITGMFISGSAGEVSANQAPKISGNIVGTAQENVASIGPMKDKLGSAIINIRTDLKAYAMTETLVINSTQHNYEDKLFAFFVWSESNIALQRVSATFEVSDGYRVTGIRAPKQSITDGPKVVNRFTDDTTFSITLLDEDSQYITSSPALTFEQNWSPELSGKTVKKVQIDIQGNIRPGDGTNTITTGPNAHYHAFDYAANAGFLVMGEKISTYNNGNPVEEGDQLTVNAEATNYMTFPGIMPSQHILGKSTLTQKATHIKEYNATVHYTASQQYLQRDDDFSINYVVEGPYGPESWIYSNFPGVEGPVMYLISPHNTKFMGDVTSGDFSQAIEPQMKYRQPVISFVKTLPDGREVIKIEYSSDITSPNYNQVIGNRRNNRTDVSDSIGFKVNYKVSDQVRYGSSTAVWGNVDNGVIFFGDNQIHLYENYQTKVIDSQDITGDGSTTDYIVANGLDRGVMKPHPLYNNRRSLTFIDPNQLSGDNANRNELGSYTIFDENNVLETAAVFSQLTTDKGYYRTNLFNGLDGDVSNIVQYLPLPQRESSSMQVVLDGPIAAPAGTEVLYSTQLQTITSGQLIDESSFVSEATLNNDFSQVKAILFKVGNLARYSSAYIEVPIKISDASSAIANVPAIVETYITATNSLDNNMIYMNGNNKLATVYLADSATLIINKVDADDHQKVLADAVFKLDGPNGYSQTFVTDDEGKIEIPNLEFGNYTLTEVAAPDGYQLNTTPLTIALNQEEKTIVVENTQKLGGALQILKVDQDDHDLLLSGAQFLITGPNDFQVTLETDANGSIYIDDLKAGNYILKEVQSPSGYLLNQEEISVSIGETLVTRVVENQKVTRTIRKIPPSNRPITGVNDHGGMLWLVMGLSIISLMMFIREKNKKLNK